MSKANLIRFYDRRPEPLSIRLGNETENLAETLQFELPAEYANAAAFLHLQLDGYADVVRLDTARTFTPSRTHTQHPGKHTAYLELLAADDVVWKSDVFYLHIGNLPEDGEKITAQYPTAFEEALQAVRTLTGMGVRTEPLPEESEATVRIAEDEQGNRIMVFGIPRGKDGSDGPPGRDGISATHSWDGTVLTVTSASGTSSADLKGEPGAPGKDGATPSAVLTTTDNGYSLTITTKNESGAQRQSVYLRDGKDGVSPTLSVLPTPDGHSITIHDISGSTSFTVSNGKDGNGIVSAVLNTDYTLTLTFDNGTSYTTPSIRGTSGKDGAAGAPGKDGAAGANGVSATHSWNGTVLTVTSASGTSSADLKGETGAQGPKGDAYILTDADKTEIAGMVGAEIAPDYWLPELETKADAIRQAAEAAGRNKSTFLWYTDAHWQTSAKASPALLRYLCKNTPVNRINFGGDILDDPASFTHANIAYAYEWRKMIADLPNHHSVFGNHDVNQWATDAIHQAYALLLAPEESYGMVVGGESYYYVDNPAEMTRYLYLSYIAPGTGVDDEVTGARMVAQGKFITDALASVGEGWHVVAIAHRWYQYTLDSDNQIVIEGGGIPFYEAEILRVFDAYNARAATHTGANYIVPCDFTNAKGKVEFCIGGHCHLDYDFESDGGIPVIVTASDTNYERNTNEAEDNGELGTITESALYGIVADYNNPESTKITVIGIGRGTSRVIGGESAPAEPVNLFDKDDPDVLDTGRFNSSNNAVAYAAGQLVTGYIEAQVGDTFTMQTDKSLNTSVYTCDMMCYNTSKTAIDNINAAMTSWVISADELTGTITIPPSYQFNANNTVSYEGTAYVRFCVAYNDINNIVITKA